MKGCERIRKERKFGPYPKKGEIQKTDPKRDTINKSDKLRKFTKGRVRIVERKEETLLKTISRIASFFSFFLSFFPSHTHTKILRIEKKKVTQKE